MKYRVVMKVEESGKTEDDPEVEKIVEALNKDEALEKAKALVREQNPELNHLKIYFWTIYLAPQAEPC